MSKQSSQKLLQLLSLLILLGLILAACGSPPPATPAPTVIPLPTMSKQENSFTFGDFVLAGVSLDNLKGTTDDNDTIMSFDQHGRRYSVVANIVTPTGSAGDWNVSWTLNQVDAKGLKLKEIDECYSADTSRKHLVRDVYNSIGVHTTSMQYSAFCLLPNDGVLYMWFTLNVMDEAYNKLLTPIGTITEGQGSTAVPFTATPTITASPTSSSTTDSGTNATSSVTPTSNGQPTREAHCPVEDPHQSNTQVKFDSVNYRVTITSTLCWHYEVGGVKSYGAYLGKKDGYDRWTWTYTMDQKTGMIKGFAVDPNTVTDFDKCWKANYAGGFLYIQCPRPATATPTITYTPTATATKTTTPTLAGTATTKP